MSELPDFKPKSFWERPEGTTGMIVGVGLVALGVWALSKMLPFIISLLENTLYAIGLGLLTIVVLWVLMDKRFWTLLNYGYRSLMRMVTGIFIEIDPIGILKSYVEDLKQSLSRMDQQIANLRGQMRKLKDVIDINEKKRTTALSIVREAKDRQNQPVMVLKAREAGRLRDSNMTLQGLYTKMEVLYRVLNKMREVSQVLVDDIESEVDVKSREREAIRASYSAFKSAMRIIKGDSDKKALFDQTMEYLTDDYGRKLGEIESFVEMSASFISSVDLQNGVYEGEALRMLELWEKKSDSILLGDEKKMLIAKSYDTADMLDLGVPKPVAVLVPVKVEPKDGPDYKKLFQ